MKIIGQTYKTGNSEVIETFKNADTALASGLLAEIDGSTGKIKASAGIPNGITGAREGDMVALVRSGLRMAVQCTDADTPAIGGQVYFDQATGKATTLNTELQVNAVFAGVKEDMELIDHLGVKTTVKGVLIDFVGGL